MRVDAGIIQRAEGLLLAETGLSVADIQESLATAMTGVDWADVYVQQQRRDSWSLEDGLVKTGHFSLDSGMGLRAVRGETTAYASSDIVNSGTLAYLKDVAYTAKTHGGEIRWGSLAKPRPTALRFDEEPPMAPAADKIALLKEIDALCRVHREVENVTASVVCAHDVVLIVRPDRRVAADFRPMVRLSVEVIVRDGGRRETGSSGFGGRFGFERLDGEVLRRLAEKACSDAREKLSAVAAPAGGMPVVLGHGWAGVILHEAVGHGLEGDFNRKRLSAFSGRIGEKVAADGVTVVDAGDIGERRGSLSCDDEGTPTQETVLIEDGVLRGYMQDIVNARLSGATPTGNGRRESYAYPPMPRMTNTFMREGGHSPEEIVASVENGLYAADFNGGEVDITNGNFVFVASKARRIVKGRLGEFVKGATIIGNGPTIMPLVSMVGDDFALDPGVGTCGKDGQWVPVGVGQPTIRVDSLTVGGTQVRE